MLAEIKKDSLGSQAGINKQYVKAFSLNCKFLKTDVVFRAKSKSLFAKHQRNFWNSKQNLKLEIPEHLKSEKEFRNDAYKDFSNPSEELVMKGKEKLVGSWLMMTTGCVFFMIVVGGYTRLSKSGLSMTKWKPLGYKYPSTTEEWAEEFENYKKYPEFLIANKDMTVEGFKMIFFVEYFHRAIGTSLGYLFTFPFLYFWARGIIKPKLRNRCFALVALGGLQGLIGWWMVKSGFKEKPEYQSRPRVSTYRLFVHLGTALVLYSNLLWNALTLLRSSPLKEITPNNLKSMLRSRRLAGALLHFIAFNLISGAMVAGIDAGKVFRDWPFMNGQLFPGDYLKKSPMWTNFFENYANVQFNHRTFGYITFAHALYVLSVTRGMSLPSRVVFSVNLTAFCIIMQFMIGIHTLMAGVPVGWGVSHQTGALLSLSSAIYFLHSVRRPSPAFVAYLKQFIK